MTQKQVQLEIFELGHKSRRDSSGYAEISEKTPQVKFPTQLCVKIAYIVIIAVISFALGVEHGKTTAKSNNSARFVAEKKVIQAPQAEKEEIQKPVAVKPTTIEGYIIQVATYKKDSSFIDKEASKLKQKGYTPVIIPSKEWAQLCAGKFASKKIADEHLKKLEQTYKGCFVRKI